jgi:hypothetical protein
MKWEMIPQSVYCLQVDSHGCEATCELDHCLPPTNETNPGGDDNAITEDANTIIGADNFNVSESNPSHVQQQTVTFKEGPGTYTVNAAAPRDPTYLDGFTDNAALANFFQRPIRLDSFEWNTTNGFTKSNVTRTIDPWALWQLDTRVKAKLQNYSYASFDLKLRFILNGTPFQYGRMLVAYIPYAPPDSVYANHTALGNQVAGQVKAFQQGSNGTTDGRDEATFQHFSTYPHVWLNPSTNQVQEFTLPFIWHNNYIALNGTADRAKETLGSLKFMDVNPLRIATASASEKVEITTYAWAENMKLFGPTEFIPTGEVMSIDCCTGRSKSQETPFLLPDEEYQYYPTSSKEEYNDAAVSSTASAVASAAGMLKNVPVIGPFARATEIGAGAMGDIAKLFGFAKPIMQQPVERYAPKLHGSLANTVGEDTAYSLALDPKQEITVDPRTVGVFPNDEMAFSSIVSREQWVARCEWKFDKGQLDADEANTIFGCLVNPSMYRKTNAKDVGGTMRAMEMDTPAGHLSGMFQYWKGSIIYRVEVVCSPFHSGRLKLQFDPWVKNGTRTALDLFTEDVNCRYTTILDLAENTSTEFKIDYCSRFPYLQTDKIFKGAGDEHFGPTRVSNNYLEVYNTFDERKHMGLFTVSVVNALVAPMDTASDASNTSAPVQVNIYMRCGDDFEFAQPNRAAKLLVGDSNDWSKAQFTQFTASSSTEYYPTSEAIEMMPPSEHSATMNDIISSPHSDDNAHVFFGERVVSLRSLIKRYVAAYTTYYNADAPTQNYEVVERFMPFIPGQVQPDKPTRRNTYLTYVAHMFLIMRGSVRYKAYVSNRGRGGTNGVVVPGVESQWIERQAFRGPTDSNGYSTQVFRDLDFNALDAVIPPGYNGAAFTNNVNQPVIEVQLPFYSNTRYMLASFIESLGTGAGETMKMNPSMTQINCAEHVYTGIDAHDHMTQYWHAAGDDFSLHFFLGVPPMFFSTV